MPTPCFSSGNGEDWDLQKISIKKGTGAYWPAEGDVQSLHIVPGSPWTNHYCETFNGKLRKELPE